MATDKVRNFIAIGSLLLSFVALGEAPALYAQAVSNATVTGRVTDQQGALVIGAGIKVTGVDTGALRQAVTNADGIYTVTNLPIGAYTLQDRKSTRLNSSHSQISYAVFCLKK